MLHFRSDMTRDTGRKPRSYEDIVRETVVDPDSSKRPSREQVQASREGHWAHDAEEGALRDRVLEALVRLGPDASTVTADVAREVVTLRGLVAEPDMLRAIEDAVARVPGVATVHNQIVVGPGNA